MLLPKPKRSARGEHVVRDCARAQNMDYDEFTVRSIRHTYTYIYIYIARVPVVRQGGLAPARPIMVDVGQPNYSLSINHVEVIDVHILDSSVDIMVFCSEYE